MHKHFETKEEAIDYIAEFEDNSFVRDKLSNNKLIYFECCVHQNCIRRLKLSPNEVGDKWDLQLTANDPHSQVWKNGPSRQDGSSIRGIHGPVRGEIKRLKNEGYTTAAMIRSEIKLNNSKGILHVP